MVREILELGNFAAEAIEGDTVSFISWYRNGRILTANKQFFALTGSSKEETDEMVWPDDFAPMETCNIVKKAMEALIQGEKSYEYEGELKRKDGSVICVELFVHVYYPAQKGEPFYFSFITDITKHKQMDEALQSALDDVNIRVEERTAELSRTIQELHDEVMQRRRIEKELEEAKEQAELYLDLMGHDIKNMDQVALGYLELAKEKLDLHGKLEKHDEMLITSPKNAVENSTKLINNIVMLRKRAGELNLTSFNVNEILSDVKSLHSNVPGRIITINIVAACECCVMANELLKDMFSNIVGNAIKHSSGTLTININVSTIDEMGQKYCKVSIDDNGPGIPDERKTELLVRACKDLVKRRGRGMGLCLVKTLVEDFHGKISVEDRVQGDYQKGSRFIVMLPAVEK